MQTTENQATPAQRLKAFFDSTGMSVRDFAKEIGSPEKFRTLYSVFNEERQPNPKLVRQIIERFPQLSFDWIYVGAGNMFLEQSGNIISQNDYDLGVGARVNQAMDRLDRMEFALNELANQITRTLANQNEAMLTFHRRVDEMRDAARAQQEEMKTNRETAVGLIEAITKSNIETNAKIDKMLARSVEAQEVVDRRSADAIAEHKALNKKVYDILEKNGKLAQTVLERTDHLASVVQENNNLQNSWQGHLESLTGAAELINQMGGIKTKQ